MAFQIQKCLYDFDNKIIIFSEENNMIGTRKVAESFQDERFWRVVQIKQIQPIVNNPR